MNKKTFVFSLAFVALLLTSCRGGRGGRTSSNPSSGQDTTITSSVEPGDYYSTINDSMSGSSLTSALNSLNNAKLIKRVGYDAMLNKPAEGFYITDPGASGAAYSITAFYSGTERKGTSGMNREHVWPASRTVGGRGNDVLEDDIHVTRPTITSENSDRGNSFYVEGLSSQSEGWDPKAAGLDESYRGDCARIIFYCAIADTRLSIVDSNNDSTGKHTMGKLSDLLKWNRQYPVTERENIRNKGAELLQGNRNPFIDHPEYAERIWGSVN